MILQEQPVVSRRHPRLARGPVKLCIVMFSLCLSMSALAAGGALDQNLTQDLNGWWLFLAFLTLLTAGIYLQSTRRRSG